MNQAASDFRSILTWNHELAAKLDAQGFPLAEFEAVQNWQRKRFTTTYEDFMTRESDAPACHFFLQELYGGMNFRERDLYVARAAPVMSRMLPPRAMLAMSEALRLQGISLELDMQMAGIFQTQGISYIQADNYAQIYRTCGRRAEREKQILLIHSLGHELENLVAMPMLLRLIKLMRGPANIAGFGKLQSFLENGVSSFGQLQNAAEFVDTIYRREWQVMEALFSAGDSSGPVF